MSFWYLQRSVGCKRMNGGKGMMNMGSRGRTLMRWRSSRRTLEGLEGISRMHGAR